MRVRFDFLNSLKAPLIECTTFEPLSTSKVFRARKQNSEGWKTNRMIRRQRLVPEPLGRYTRDEETSHCGRIRRLTVFVVIVREIKEKQRERSALQLGRRRTACLAPLTSDLILSKQRRSVDYIYIVATFVLHIALSSSSRAFSSSIAFL